MVGVGFNFLSKSDFCSWIMLRESFRLAVTMCVCVFLSAWSSHS